MFLHSCLGSHREIWTPPQEVASGVKLYHHPRVSVELRLISIFSLLFLIFAVAVVVWFHHFPTPTDIARYKFR